MHHNILCDTGISNMKGFLSMARESKNERQARELITSHLAPGETLNHFTWGGTNSASAAWMLFGVIGVLLARRGQKSYFVGLTDQRMILLSAKGLKPNGEIYSIPLSDIKGLKYSRGLYSGALNIHLIADQLDVYVDSRPWYPRAQQMAKLLPLPK